MINAVVDSVTRLVKCCGDIYDMKYIHGHESMIKVMTLEGGVFFVGNTETLVLETSYQSKPADFRWDRYKLINGEFILNDNYIGTPFMGMEVELQRNGSYVQWKYSNDDTWNNLIDIIELKGDQGPPGIDPPANYYVHNQTEPSGEWNVMHNIGKLPIVRVLDVDGYEVEASIQHVSMNQVKIFCTPAFVGKVICRA